MDDDLILQKISELKNVLDAVAIGIYFDPDNIDAIPNVGNIITIASDIQSMILVPTPTPPAN